MKNIKFSRLFAAMLFAACLALTACQQQPEEKHEAFEGTWLDASAGKSYYKISSSTFENYGEDTKGVKYDSYAGDNLTFTKISDTAGIIYIKYTRAADSNWKYTTDATKAPDIGKWYAIAYKDLTDKSIKICGAYKSDGKKSCSTLEEAKTEFTEANGYFSWFTACAKQ